MNKGRNIFLVMICLVCVSVLAFLTLFERGNTTGTVGDVRYYLASTDEQVKVYEFYFPKGEMTSAEVTESSSKWVFNFADESYTYVVSGTDRENCKVEVVPVAVPGVEHNEPFEKYSKELFKVIVFGKKDLLSLWQAITVAIIALIGGCFIMYAEELWHVFKRKGKDEYPEWKEMTIFKYIGGCTIAVSVILLIIFLVL